MKIKKNQIFFCFNYSNKDVSAKDIVSGIISAANRKMLRAATGSHQGKSSSTSGSASTNKKDSVDKSSSETSKSTQKLDTIDSSNKHHSRRNSESVIDLSLGIILPKSQELVNCLDPHLPTLDLTKRIRDYLLL